MIEDKLFFKATLDGTGQEYIWTIEDNQIIINWELIWILDDEDYIPITQQLESILSLTHYQLEKVFSSDEINPFNF